LHKEKEYLSDWFKAGLEELGLSVSDYQKMSVKEKNELKKELEEMGHF